jgi:hypothetical protein
MGPEVPTGSPHAARFLGRMGHARSALVAPLLRFFFPTIFLLVKYLLYIFPGPFVIQKVLKHKKYGKREFSDSQKLNTKNEDFVRKFHKLSKTCKNNNEIMQITI